jgi:hypothetical protein
LPTYHMAQAVANLTHGPAHNLYN